jgi:glycosyltransferase involved in cell wall biosynthesis
MPAESRKDVVASLGTTDIVHVHDYNPIIFRYLLKYKSGKIIYTEHGNFGIGRRIRITERIVRRIFQRTTVRKDVQFVFNSRFTKDYAISIYGKQLDCGVVIYNGLSKSDHQHAEHLTNTDNSFRLLFLGRLVPQKGLNRFLPAVSEVRKVIPELSLSVIGDGPERGYLEETTRSLGLEQVVSFAGYQMNTAYEIAKSDLVVIPSYGEPFGLVALEAMRMGKPIAVYVDGGGVVEIANMIGDRCVAFGNVEMTEIITDYWYMKQQGDIDPERYIRVASEFSVKRMCREYDVLYAKCLMDP